MSIPETNKILYVSDLGKHTRPVFRQALAQARAHNARLIMLHVVEPMSESAKMAIGAYLSPELIKSMQEDGMKQTINRMKERVKNFVKEECRGGICELTPVEEIFVVAGRPSEEILRIAEEQGADLIIMGKATHKVKGRRVVGSTAKRVSRYANIPVMIVSNNK